MYTDQMMGRGPRIGIVVLGTLAVAAAAVFLIVPAQMQDMKDKKLTGPLHAPRIVVKKKSRILEVYDGDKLVKTYPVVLGFSPEGDKEKEGDGRTPEGEFYIFTRNPESRFHLSLGVSYPSKDDAALGLASGRITRSEHDEIARAIDKGKMPPQKTALGGEIYIHGGGTERDWTWGCIAMKNEDIEELFAATPVGAPVSIVP